MKIDLQTSSELVFYRSPLLIDLYADVCTDYMEYLADARGLLKVCQMKCACWSAPYDGQSPAPPDPSSVERERSISNLSAPVTNGDIPNRRSLGPEDGHAPVKRSISATEYEQKQSKPDLGPFLVTLFQKIERMPQNSFYVNLILTGVVSRLALYPQPLLRSFLLNYNMVLKPGVRSLFQVGNFISVAYIYKLFTGWEVRIVKNFDWGLENATRCREHSRNVENTRPTACVFYISFVFLNARRVLSQCNTLLRLLYLFNIYTKKIILKYFLLAFDTLVCLVTLTEMRKLKVLFLYVFCYLDKELA